MDINKPLEDLVKQEASSRKSTRGRGRGGRGRGRGRSTATSPSSRGASQRGGARGSGRGAATGVPRAQVPRQNTNPATRRPAPIARGALRRTTIRSPGAARTTQGSRLPERWQHDMYNQGKSGDLRETLVAPSLTTTGTLAKQLGPSGLSTGTKMLVTNLESNVTKEDMEELFGTCGPLKRVEMTEVGVATIVFQRRTDALKAQQKYNQVKLDGRPMYLQVEDQPVAKAAVTPSSTRVGGARPKVTYTVKV
eukprot:m.27574 g.27574  ORF g.27574 m.27574 type:complete len:251 (-) comp10274_c0_seq1:219-971(-)